MEKEKKILWENLFSQYIVQGANYILPLVTFPYLVRTLGASQFGVINYVMSLMQYFILLTDYGFNFTATRAISLNRVNNVQIGKYFTTVYYIKFVFLVISFVIVSLLILFIPIINNIRYVCYATFIAVIGNFLYPIWLFQGLEKIKIIAIINLISRLIATILIFILVKNQNQVVLASVLQCIPVVISGLIALFVAFIVLKIKLKAPLYDDIKHALIEAWPLFLSMLYSSIFSNAPILVLGFFADMKIVGYYTIAFKIVQVFINLHIPISVTIYPRLGYLFMTSRERALKLIKVVLNWGTPAFFMTTSSLFLMSSLFTTIIYGEGNVQISLLVKIMSILPLAIFLDNIFGVLILLNNKGERQYMKSMAYGGVSCLIFLGLFVPHYKAYGAAISFVLSELIILSMYYYFSSKKGMSLKNIFTL